jgi:hypothetical protein
VQLQDRLAALIDVDSSFLPILKRPYRCSKTSEGEQHLGHKTEEIGFPFHISDLEDIRSSILAKSRSQRSDCVKKIDI